MVRTLPWLRNATSADPQLSLARPTKRQRLLDSSSDLNAPAHAYSTRLSPALPTPRPAVHSPHRSARPYRTPSTSPPPAPPSIEELRPGLNADDIYIMVEDEFHAVARTFTAHLHHAEYVHLKNMAKVRNTTSIVRPTDSVTAMRAETKLKKLAEARAGRAKAGVEKVVGGVEKGVGGGNGDGGSDSGEDEGERLDDPWQGTQLQRFMVKSPKKDLKALTGLQGVLSSTRAAKGMGRPEKFGGKNDKVSSAVAANVGGANKRDAESSSQTDDDDDDDLDAPARAPSRPTAKLVKPAYPPALNASPSSKVNQQKTRAPSPSRLPPRRSFLDMSPIKSSPAPKPTRSDPQQQPKSDSLVKKEPLEASRSLKPDRDVLKRLKARKEREEREKRQSSGMCVDEIPIFLV